ncbi:MAG: nucleotidyl transferase AbiEii/AbiGii toxin family protein [Patescibacteria group bacterium]
MITKEKFEEICEEAYRNGVPREYRGAVLREYIQCELLSILYSLPGSERLGFIGGTALRLLWGLDRFSEDLDFDNLSDDKNAAFELFLQMIERFSARGYATRFPAKKKGEEYGGNLYIANILYEFGLSPHRDQNLLIKLDYTTPPFRSPTTTRLLNRFGFLVHVVTEPREVLCARKLHALFARPRTQPRDMYDIVWYFSHRIKPDLATLRNAGIDSYEILNAMIQEKMSSVSVVESMKSYENDLVPIVIDPAHRKRIHDLPALSAQFLQN